ncbi:mucin-5AC-like [Papilio machaon]|uniref:mucin-5AC-like n=1 Tax=Papilio machaon TaxID=76193 RepID=UPI001E662C7D|nr:mucin-5AC-like [Papilio machaon]
MTTKSYSKHKEYKEISSRGTVPYTDEQFDMMKSELLPKGSKLDSLARCTGTREYHYEYKEEKLPGGKYDRKDYHTVEEYTIPDRSLPKSAESSSYYYEKEEREIPAITTGTRTYNYETTGTSPVYSKVNSKVTKEMSQNVEELDSLLDDLQKDQERQLYKSGYTSDTAESTSFDYRRGTPVKAAPSSGYSTLKHEERLESSSWGSSPAPVPTLTRAAELRQQMYREEKTESRVVPAVVPAPVAQPVPAAVCTHCHQPPGTTGTLPRGSTPMNKVTTTVKTYTYEVPADTDPSVPIPTHADTHTYVCNDTHRTATLSRPVDGSPAPGGCQYCSHCNTRLHYSRTHLTTDEHTTSNERMVYPNPTNESHVPHVPHALPTEPHNGHGPYGPTTYKYSETSYSSHNSTLSPPPHAPHAPHRHPSPSPAPSPAPFPRPHTPSPSEQQPPKRLDDLLADFPEARFPTQTDGVRRRIETSTRETRDTSHTNATPTPNTGVKPTPNTGMKPTPVGSSKNVAGPAVYYPPGHTPFAPKKEVAGYEASAMQGGGAYASGRGMYEYESGARSKEKHYEKKTAVPVCLPLCCAMPCVIL